MASNTNAGRRKTGSTKAKNNGRKPSAQKKGSGTKVKDEDLTLSPEKKRELYLFAYLAVAIFLFCSNLGLCGFIGRGISGFFFGLFGTVTYIIPIYIFLSAAFLLSNGPVKRVVKKVIWVGVALLVVGFICQIAAGADEMTIKRLYEIGSKDKKGGGVLFGGILVLLYKMIGKVGTVILTVLLSIVVVILVTDISIIDFGKKMFTFDFGQRDDEDADIWEDEDEEVSKRGPKPSNILNNIDILNDGDSSVKGNKSKRKRKKDSRIKDEEVHEIKPEKTDFSDLWSEPAQNVPVEQEDIFASPKKPASQNHVGQNSSIDEMVETAKKDIALETSTILNPLSKVKYDRHETNSGVSVLKPSKETYVDEISGSSEVPVYDSAFVRAADPENKHLDRNPSEEAETQSTDFGTVTKKDREEATKDVQEEISQNSSASVKKKEYKFPPVSLLVSGRGKGGRNNESNVRETALKLKSTLESFGVNVTITNYSCGPAVTRYEMQPEQGVKVSKILSLADDIKLNLAAADIRIEAPIPGKAAIGIEVPNKENQTVFFRDLIDNENFRQFPSNIAFAVGKDISGQVIVSDIAKMPHLLIAGSTGSGKSVCINTLIMSILYKAKPDDVKMIMIDPKMVELTAYNGIPHLLIPVVTDPKKASGALNWAVMEMTNRYQLFAQYNVRNIQGYNKKVEEVHEMDDVSPDSISKLPQIVVIVDELADLMMVAHGEVEDAIVRLSQLARAAGIHLVIATQRPSVDVITGLIKANVPSRIAFAVSSGVDSRTIIDQVGAEKLLGKGDMLFYPTGYTKPVRVQGAFVSDEEVVSVVNYIKKQFGESEYDENVSRTIDSSVGAASSSGSAPGAGNDRDEYFEEAARLVIEKDKASIGNLQRVFRIGFNRAARIMDQLCDAGVVGPEEGTKPRQILMTMEQFEDYMSV